MTTLRVRSAWILVLVVCELTACAREAPVAVVRAGMRNLRCPSGEGVLWLNRETPKVREYIVACDFRYTRVHCSDRGCRAAAPKPPCTKAGCFEEDPITLEWKLRPRQSFAAR
jgi:hypothetical protein